MPGAERSGVDSHPFGRLQHRIYSWEAGWCRSSSDCSKHAAKLKAFPHAACILHVLVREHLLYDTRRQAKVGRGRIFGDMRPCCICSGLYALDTSCANVGASFETQGLAVRASDGAQRNQL